MSDELSRIPGRAYDYAVSRGATLQSAVQAVNPSHGHGLALEQVEM